jgi:hypothetical protein
MNVNAIQMGEQNNATPLILELGLFEDWFVMSADAGIKA